MKKIFLLFCSLVFLFHLLGESASATTIVAEASAGNGDFTISEDYNYFNVIGQGNGNVGDGIDEMTYWEFDYTGDANYTHFQVQTAFSAITSAWLTIEVAPYSYLFDNDFLQIFGLNHRVYHQFTLTNPNDVEHHPLQTVGIELMDYYSTNEIYSILTNTDGNGLLPMLYMDDAIVSYASLALTNDATDSPAAPVPEPGTLLLLSTGVLLGRIGLSRKKMNG